jgi:hypothetical protein
MSNDYFDPKGVIPACLMPFDARVNGHATDVHALSFKE